MKTAEQRAEIDATARRMLARYSSAKVARGMAWDHAMGHEAGTPFREYWEAVYFQINALTNVNRGGAK